jgi:hypothetical protein
LFGILLVIFFQSAMEERFPTGGNDKKLAKKPGEQGS